MTNYRSPRPAVFVDRDGTLVEDVNYLSNVDDIRLFEHTEESVRLLKECGFLVVVVTNQSGIGRGIFEETAMHSIHDSIQEKLSGALDAFYFCPHLPDDDCRCRKPAVELIERATRDLDIDLANSWMVGDKKADVETGFNAGTGTALVLTGYGADDVGKLDRMPDIVADNLLEAARQICSRLAERD